MLSEIAVPEKEVTASTPEELQNFLDTTFKTSYLPTTLDRILFRPDGTIECEGHQFPCAQGFLEALSVAIRMPLAYAYQLDGQLFTENFEQRKERCSKAVTICINRGMAVNLADAVYRPARTVDVLAGVVDASFWKFDRVRLSDRGVEINLIQPGCAITP